MEIISGQQEADWVFAGVTSDPNYSFPGPLYYIDSGANRVRVINTGLTTSDTVAGTGMPSYPGTGYVGESGPAWSAARVSTPRWRRSACSSRPRAMARPIRSFN